MLVAVISALFLAASIALGVRALRNSASTAPGTASADAAPARTRVPYRASGIAWGVVFCLIQLFLVVWSALGLVQQDALSAVAAGAVLTCCAGASFNRPRLAARLHARTTAAGRAPHLLAAAILAMLLAGACAVLALEIPSNHVITWIYPLCLLLEYGLVTGCLMGLFFVAQRRGAAPAVLVFGLMVLGIAEYFIITFKSTPIQPGDLFALSTAVSVSAGYVYSISAFCLYGIAFGALAMMLCSLAATLAPAPAERRLTGARWIALNVVLGLVCLGGVTAHVTLIDYYNTLGIQIYTWRPLESYYRQGYLPAFISSAQTIRPPVPAGYDYDEAAGLIDDYAAAYDESAEATSADRAAAKAQFDDEQPTVIAVMNETFSDLSIYQNLHAGYEGPTYFKSISDALARGQLYVSAYGGGTCNTEFEFLTGSSMSYLGQGVYPYTIYDLTETENLARQFGALGYDTTAMHPNHGTNWNRENVYEALGFDRFLTIEDFQGAETLRGMVTDGATYDKILELLETNEDPQFIFDVTMQNHSGYTTGLIPAEQRTDYRVDGIYDAEVNEYLALINESDRALERFISALRQLDRKVVVVFFGDHQPYFPSKYNDAWFTNENPATHAERLWQTSYVIWANYDVAGNSQTSEVHDISVNYLAAYLNELIGAPLTDYQKAQLAVHEAMPAINTTGFEDRSGTWYLTGQDLSEIAAGSDGDDAGRARNDLAKMQYYMLFGDGRDIYTKTTQSAANETDPNLAPGTTKIK